MKKIGFVSFIVICCVLLATIVSFAAYNYSAPPVGSQQWDFSSDKQYTIAQNMDLIYTKGKSGVLGIGRKNTSVTVKVKAKDLYFSYGIAGLVDSNGTIIYNPPEMSDTINREYVHTQQGLTVYPPQVVQYEGETYQLNQNALINKTYYAYNSSERVIIIN